MPSGFVSNGTDLDSLFKARSGAARANVGFQVGGTDLAQRYEQSVGGDQIASNTGFVSGGSDLKLLFQDINYVAISAALSYHFVDSTQTSPTTATSGFQLNSSGVAKMLVQSSYTDVSGEWLVAGANTDFECRATIISGTLTTGTTGSWQSLSSTREWTISTPAGVKTTSFTLEIRLAASPFTVLASATIELYAESS